MRRNQKARNRTDIKPKEKDGSSLANSKGKSVSAFIALNGFGVAHKLIEAFTPALAKTHTFMF